MFLETANGYWIPLFDLNLLARFAWLIVVWTLAWCAGEVIKMVISRYNKKYALTTSIADGIVIIAVGILFLNPNIMNAEFVPHLNLYFASPMPSFIASVLRNANIIIFVVVLLVVVTENILTWIKAVKYCPEDFKKTNEEETEVLVESEEKEETTTTT
jgi:hypothetical protein